MKKLPISSRGWVLIGLTSLILMFGALHSYRQGNQTYPISGGGSAGGTGTDVPVNTLDDSNPPPMPDGGGGTVTSGGGTVTTGGGAITAGGPTSTGGTGSLPPSSFDDPPANGTGTTGGTNPPPVTPPVDQHVVVWVSEEGASAYAEPGFNMPKVRDLKKWEELKIVEKTRERWDKVRDLDGNEFWVEKKIVTIIRPQNLNQPSHAETTVMKFFTAVAQTRHSDAYVYLSPEWKRELSFDRFVEGYSHVDSLRSEIVNVFEFEGGERYQVDVAQEAVEEGEPVDYLGIYTVGKIDDKWYLTSGSLKKQIREF